MLLTYAHAEGEKLSGVLRPFPRQKLNIKFHILTPIVYKGARPLVIQSIKPLPYIIAVSICGAIAITKPPPIRLNAFACIVPSDP